MSALRRCVWVVLLCSAVSAAPDGLRVFRREMRAVDKAERAFWQGYNRDFLRAAEAWRRPIKKDRRYKAMEVDGDFILFRALYEDYAVIEERRGKACEALAASGHARAAEKLLAEFFSLSALVDQTEKELRETNNRVYGVLYDQRPGVRRHGLAFREQALHCRRRGGNIVWIRPLDGYLSRE